MGSQRQLGRSRKGNQKEFCSWLSDRQYCFSDSGTADGTDRTAASITKRDIFHYVYAILHHPVYREKYAANLKVATDARFGITNDPNRADDPNYILRLVGQIVTVSLETVRIVKEIAALSINS